MQPFSTDATWEELYDSGQLDRQLAQIHLATAAAQQQPLKINPLGPVGPHQGLAMRPLLPEQPPQQALMMPNTHHPVKPPGPHSMAVYGGNTTPIVHSTPMGNLNSPPTLGTIIQQNGYPISNQNIAMSSQYSDLRNGGQNRMMATGNCCNAQGVHDQQLRPLMSIMSQPPVLYQQSHHTQSNPNGVTAQSTNQPQNLRNLSKISSQAPINIMQNNSVPPRAPFQPLPQNRMGPPVGYNPINYHHGPQGAMVLPQLPSDPRPIGPIPIDMSVPPPPIPMNGKGPVKPHNVNYQNGYGQSNAQIHKNNSQKLSKNKNSRTNLSASANTHNLQKTSPIQPVFPPNSTSPEQMNAKAAAAAYNAVHVESDHPRTLYRPPEPKVTILKRPVSTPSNLSLQASNGAGVASDNSDEGGGSSNNIGGINNIRTKSLKQREEEYAQARLRIMGSTEPEIEEDPSNSNANEGMIASSSQSTPNVHAVQQKSSGKNRLSGGTSLIVISNSPQNGKASPPTKRSIQNETRFKEDNGSKTLNVGQGSES